MQKLVVDTNFLLCQFEFRIDLVSELVRISRGPITLVVSSGTIDELNTLAGRTGNRATAARFALQNFDAFKKRFKVEIVKSEGKVDEWIIKYVQKNKVAVATNDVQLRGRLQASGVPIIVVKSKSKLDYA